MGKSEFNITIHTFYSQEGFNEFLKEPSSSSGKAVEGVIVAEEDYREQS